MGCAVQTPKAKRRRKGLSTPRPYGELSEAAKARARDCWREKGWTWDQWDSGYLTDLFAEVLLEEYGIEVATRTEKLSGGKTIQDTTELLGSPRMKSLVDEMKARYADRYVIFDLPSLLEGADAITFAPLVDGIVMVAEAGRNSAKEINEALEVIPKEKFLGFVLNRHLGV